LKIPRLWKVRVLVPKKFCGNRFFNNCFSSNFNLNSKPITMKPLLLLLSVLFAVSCAVKNPANFDLKNIQEKNPEISVIPK
jgi:hypothetical protein